MDDIDFDDFDSECSSSDTPTEPPEAGAPAPILAAVEAESVDTVRNLIPTTSPADLSAALCRSCEEGKLAIAEALLESGQCDPNAADKDITPLFLAAHNAHPTLVEVLLRHGADVNIKSNRGRNKSGQQKQLPLHSVPWSFDHPRIRDGPNLLRRRAVLELLLDAGCNINSKDDDRTLLLQCMPNDIKLAPFLLRRGADPNVADHLGRTALHFFHDPQDEPDLFKMFMDHGARLDLIFQPDGTAALHTFASNHDLGDLSMFKPYVPDWNITTSDGDTVLHIAVEKHRPGDPTVPALLALGMSPAQRNHKGQQAIHKVDTAYSDCEEILDILCAAGSDLEAKDSRGNTLLTSAVCGPNSGFHSETLVPSLINRGANINAQDYKGNGVLSNLIGSFGFQSNQLDNLKKLGADPLMQNYAGQDFLHRLASGYAAIDEETAFLTIINLLGSGHCPTVCDFQGRTALHALCSHTSDHLFAASPVKGKCAIDLLLDAGLDAALNMPDYQGVRPIHLAATTSEILVGKLIARGADAAVTTKDGRNLLHIAATARQSNVVGLLLDHYASNNMTSMVNMQSDDGRTPLHLACRSGRLETVNLLLNHGADTQVRDKSKRLPIDACSEFLVESRLWIANDDQENILNNAFAAGILAQDKERPLRGDTRPNREPFNPKKIGWKGEITSEDSTLGSGRIVRALALKGGFQAADITEGVGSMFLAQDSGDEEMAAELVRASRELGINIETSLPFSTESLLLRSRHLSTLLKQIFTSPCTMDLDLFQLVIDGHHNELAEALEENPTLVRDDSDGVFPDFLFACARWGYTDIFRRIGSIMPDSDWIDGGHEVLDGPLIPYLLAAAERQLPNLELIKVIVEKFEADVNIRFKNDMVSKPEIYYQSPMAAARAYKDGDTILHHLAQGAHWWYEGAIRYLLQHGANPNARNAEGKTPLCVAVSRSELGGHRRWEIVNILLEGGADPNIAATCGFTPLAMSAHNKRVFRLLVERGAVPSRDHPMELFQALCSFDEEIVSDLLGMGLDVNNTTLSSAQPHWHAHRLGKAPWSKTEVIRPLHYISMLPFNESHCRDHSIRMIKMLLSNGADCFLPCDADKLILHEIFSDGGIIKPWLDMPDIDLERRDPRGRTLLLSAARCQLGADSYACVIPVFPFRAGNIIHEQWKEGDVTRPMALYRKGADLTAIDNFGNTVFHHMAGCQPKNTFAAIEYQRTVRLFMERVPEFEKRVNLDGKTPFAIAKEQGVKWAMDIFEVQEEQNAN
jgi:ankyrin repeat protein